MPREIFIDDRDFKKQFGPILAGAAALAVFILGILWICYAQFVVEVPAYHVGILVKKTGKDLSNSDIVAPDAGYKGVQKDVLDVGRYFFKYDPYNWAWEIKPQKVIADGSIGVKVRLFGDNLPYGEFLAYKENEMGIVPGVLLPGRYPINPYLYDVEEHTPQVVPAGYKGVVVNAPERSPSRPEDYWDDSDKTHQKLLVKPGFRGVENETLNPARTTSIRMKNRSSSSIAAISDSTSPRARTWASRQKTAFGSASIAL